MNSSMLNIKAWKTIVFVRLTGPKVMMLFPSVCLVSLLSSSLAAPFSRSTGDELLAALGTGVSTGLGGALHAGAETAANLAVHEVTSLLSNALTSILGKRDIINLQSLEQDLKTSIATAITTEIEGLSNILGKSDLETDIVGSLQQLLESTITKGVETFLSDLKVKRSKMGDELLAALTPEISQAAATIATSALTPLTTALSSGLSSLTSGAVSGITHVLSSIFG
ncbi:uncharacterized protein [Haliotis cracherodii]|uniref:uncharacterized protein n=1 Tax=Haliotis cracherodii TaxID=6455 RepID=UPI0039E9E5C9